MRVFAFRPYELRPARPTSSPAAREESMLPFGPKLVAVDPTEELGGIRPAIRSESTKTAAQRQYRRQHLQRVA